MTFQVNLSVQNTLGSFSPGADTVTAAGSFNGWNASSFRLTPSPGNADIYTGTFNDTANGPGSTIQYKFIITRGGTMNWESINNRSFTLASAAQTLNPVFFNDKASAGVVPITFQVNMSVQEALGNFDPATDTVLAAGTFNGWSTTSFPLSPSAQNASIYTGTFNDATDQVGGTVQYKIIINRFGTLNWESINNRTFTLASPAQTLEPVFFNNVSQVPGTVAITFQVNMKVQAEIGRFDPATDNVICAGSFDNWSTTQLVLEPSASDPNIYVGTFMDSNDPAGSQVQYKFIIGSLAGLNWEGINNRVLTLPATNITLPVVYFNNLERNPGLGTPVTFQVDLSAQIALGSFDPETSSVSVAGTLNNWSTTASPLTRSETNPNLYVGTFNNAVDAPGNVAQFKFVLNGGTWESIDNRTYLLASSAQILAPVFFNNISTVGTLAVSLVGNDVLVEWPPAARVRLQKATRLTNPNWADVPDTEGAGSASLPLGAGNAFFRLAGP